MNVQEWALVIFTTLAQMSVGSFIVLGIIHTFVRRSAGEDAADRLSDRALLAIGPILVLAMLASLFHLGNPLNAPRAVTNLAASWLSREIFFGVLFSVSGGLFAIMQWRKIGSFAVRNAIAWLAALIGIALVVSMVMVYMLPTQPVWNSLATPVYFFSTTVLLGLFAVGAAYVANYAYVQRNDPSCAEEQCALLRSALRWIAISAVVVLGIELVTIPLHLAQLSNGSAPALASVQLMIGQYGVVLALRIALVFVGAGILGFFLYQNASSPGREQIMGSLAYLAFGLVLVAEVLGRFLFYASQVPIGL
jgi:anaerobic dimethyl sulfoxide reductase subunit C (anchor subunit)